MFGKYSTKEDIYLGERSCVYRGVRDADGLPVVIKALAPGRRKAVDIARLKHEYNLLSQLKVKGIPEALSYEADNSQYALILRDYRGISLKQYARNGKLDLESLLVIGIQLCSILSELHGRKIIHKDIKPANIIIDPETREVYLVDFSLSTKSSSGQHVASGTGMLEGSLAYMAPEQTERMNRPVDYRTDLYSLGVTLFELTTGHLPYSASHPLEWVHAHLALGVPDPRTLVSDLPAPIASIIMILLSKTSEDRYQSAFSLKQDLEQCLAQWREKGRIDPFTLSVGDTYGLFMSPAKLYGREKELKIISGYIQDVREKPEFSLMLISGYSGIGKTSLVHEAYKQISVANGLFSAGKFEMLNRSVPYFGFIHAFSNLSRQLLSERDEFIDQLKRDLLQSIGSNAQIINRLIPSFENIMGKHPEPPALLPEDEANRFVITLTSFVKTLASRKPLVIFLDDLQWADVASLTLLERLSADPEIKNLGIIGAYRDNEVDEVHQLSVTMRKISDHIAPERIELTNLVATDIEALLTDAFRAGVTETRELASLLLDKTQGNPFFIVQALVNFCDDGVIRFDTRSGKWSWDLGQLANMNISENVVDLMLDRIRKLDAGSQRVLQMAACIGNSFTLGLLSHVCEPADIPRLSQAIENGLVLTRDDGYLMLSDPDRLAEVLSAGSPEHEAGIRKTRFRFLHDRVQQAAYSMLQEQEAILAHLRLGRGMNRGVDRQQALDEAFAICNHYNAGIEHITETAERLDVAGLNFLAAKKAKSSTAYQQGATYADTGLSLLPADAAGNYYRLWYDLTFESAECKYLAGDFASGEKQLDQLIKNGRSRYDKLMALRSKVNMYAVNAEREKVILTVKQSLALFNVILPKEGVTLKLHVIADIAEIKWRTFRKSIDELLELPVCQDEDQVKLAELLVRAGPSIYLSSQDHFAWIVLFEARYALRRGFTASSPQGFIGYGMILQAAFGDVDSAFSMADFCKRLNEKLGNPFVAYRLWNIFYLFISHLRNRVDDEVQASERLAREALADGDSLYYGLNSFHYICCRIFRGDSLREIREDGMRYLRQLRQLNNDYAMEILLSRLQFTFSLAEQTPVPESQADRFMSVDERILKYEQQKGYSNIALLYVSVYASFFFVDEHAERIDVYLRDGWKKLSFIAGSFSNLDFTLYQCLCCYKLSRKHGRSGEYVTMVNAHRRRFMKLTKTGASAYAAYFPMVDLCWHLVSGKAGAVLASADEWISKVSDHGQPHLSAIGKELIGQLCMDRGQQARASAYLLESALDYERWEAVNKVRYMRTEYPSVNFSGKTQGGRPDPETSITQEVHALDLESLMRSATAISGEIHLDRLLPAMINIVVENAGAGKGVLLISENGTLVPKAKRETSSPAAELLDSGSVENAGLFSLSAVQLAVRTGEPVMSDNAFYDDRFRTDAYVMSRETRSLLAVPIIHKGETIGVIYLENDLASHTFTSERISVVKILCSQIAISLDNALLYRNLEDALHKQVELTEAYSRFTPREYLRFLGHDSILEVKLGDYRVERMTVLFTDIRSYTSIAEKFSAEDNFHFLRTYLRKMTEIVTKNKGMVNQLLGDGILAFFDDANHALAAAIEMQVSLQDYTVTAKDGTVISVKAGAGLHSGEVIIGIMGSEKSMDTGIVSDTVNVASRIEGLTKRYGVNILLSDEVAARLDDEAKPMLRRVGRVIVKGKHQDVGLFECFGGDRADLSALKSASRDDYDKAFDLFGNARFTDALHAFEGFIERCPEDRLVQYYLTKCRELSLKPPEAGWTPVEDIQTK